MDEENILKVLIKIIYLIDYKDNYTLKHCENVSKYSILLGKQLGLDETDLKIIEIGAFLHDIGKIGIPDFLLVKSTSLTNKEFELIKKHVTIGEALMPNVGYEEIKKIIRYHHERIDGRGYPDGLKGSDIPYFARIVSVADTFDAMITQRAYNNPKTLNEAFTELLKVSNKQVSGSGEIIQQLDSHLVKVFINLIKNNEDLMERFHKKDDETIIKRKKMY